MSELIIKFQTTELQLVKDLTVYNSIVHKLKFSKFNFDNNKYCYRNFYKFFTNLSSYFSRIHEIEN